MTEYDKWLESAPMYEDEPRDEDLIQEPDDLLLREGHWDE